VLEVFGRLVVLGDSQHEMRGLAWADLVLSHLKVPTPVGDYAIGIIRGIHPA